MLENLIHSTVNLHPGDLRPHPKNYRKHPPQQLQHLMESIKQHGFYRNVIVAEDFTILAGHGVVKAAKKLKLDAIPVIRLNLQPNDPAALKVLAGDNEIGNLGELNETALLEILNELKDEDELFGTGFDTETLDGLFQKIQGGEFARQQWVGLPEFEMDDKGAFRQIVVSFETEADLLDFTDKLGISITDKTRALWYPLKSQREMKALSYEED